MKELFDVFKKLKLPYFRQGSLSNDDYPNSFFTFWNYATPNMSFYDNEEHRYIEKIMVYFYTNDPNLIYSKMDEFIEEAKKSGLQVEGRPYDVASGKENFYGRLVRINIIHKL